ncbi:hypothetical protein C4F40_02525 [Sphingobacterium sp. Ka21]|uniref:Uncharacterized protein n=1 Tax=Sphingobacterium pedocola TaxID=2082722 RepID=A0ABR9T2N4_9SPHI|nr:hypothetical protein [Sphingobacterium pedocola]
MNLTRNDENRFGEKLLNFSSKYCGIIVLRAGISTAWIVLDTIIVSTLYLIVRPVNIKITVNINCLTLFNSYNKSILMKYR